jgi:hypothetical protein
MATPYGIIGFQGTIGGISFYMRNGKPCARKAGGPSREKIASSEKCQRTRENNAEFKGAIAASKFLRLGLNAFRKNYSDWNLSGRLNGLFRKMIGQGNGLRGERPVEILNNKDMLIGFNLNKDVSFDGIFKAGFSLSANASRNECTIMVPDFDAGKCLDAPSGASHFRLVNAITVLPEFSYDPLAKDYFRADGMNLVLKANAFSDYLSLDGNIGSDITLTASLPASPLVSAESGLVCCIGISFYQEVAGSMYLLQSGAAMKIMEVF